MSEDEIEKYAAYLEDGIADTDTACPICGHCPTRSRSCTAISCDEGWIDCYEDDAINYAPGEEYEMCEECQGTGVVHWCPSCGAFLSGRYTSDEEEEELQS